MTTIDDVMARLIRVESRIVQMMNHMGVTPKGVLPDKDDPEYWEGKRLNREAELEHNRWRAEQRRDEP